MLSGSQKFADFVEDLFLHRDFEKCKFTPNFYIHRSKSTIVEIHRDDFHLTGPESSLIWARDSVKIELMLKASDPMFPGFQHSFLQCCRVRRHTGTAIQIPEKHIEKMIEGLCMKGCKLVPTPCIDDQCLNESPQLRRRSTRRSMGSCRSLRSTDRMLTMRSKKSGGRPTAPLNYRSRE